MNLGTGVETSIRETAEIVRRGDRVRRARSAGTRRCRTGSRAAALDTSRARELFGFKAQVPLRDGIARTVAWYRESLEP